MLTTFIMLGDLLPATQTPLTGPMLFRERAACVKMSCRVEASPSSV